MPKTCQQLRLDQFIFQTHTRPREDAHPMVYLFVSRDLIINLSYLVFKEWALFDGPLQTKPGPDLLITRQPMQSINGSYGSLDCFF